MEEVFPNLSQLPEQLSAHLQNMLDCLEQVMPDGLPKFREYDHIFQVLDTDGKLKCLFKAYCDDNEQLARNEACVYILDHPEDDHRSRSSQIYGFSGVPPSVFVRFRMGNEMKMGLLVDFVESKGSVNKCGQDGITVEEIHKIVMADIRFGNMDRNNGNLLVREGENGSLKLVPIDHEFSFSNSAQDYNICSPSWLSWLKSDKGIVNIDFSLRFVNYVARLNPDVDIEFLRRCGWEPDDRYIENFKVFAIFLKKSVSEGLTAKQIGEMASYKCDELQFNLQVMIDSIERDDKFFDSVGTHIEECMREFKRRCE